MKTLLERFREKYEEWSGKVHVAKSIAEIAPILKDKIVAAAGLPEDLLREIREHVDELRDPREADLGITAAAFAIADTGTLVEISSADEVRQTSTLPGIHVGIVREADIIRTSRPGHGKRTLSLAHPRCGRRSASLHCAQSSIGSQKGYRRRVEDRRVFYTDA